MKIKLPNDLYYFLGSFIALVIILKIVFVNEDLIVVMNFTSSFFWILVIPAFIMTYIYEKINFIERFVLSVVLSAALMGIGMYYLGLVGVHIKYSTIILPILYFSFSGLILVCWKMRKHVPKEII